MVSFSRLSVLFALFYSTICFAQKAVPALQGKRVHDEAGVLGAPLTAMLEKQLESYEDSTTNQIAILIITSLDAEIIEEYALRVAEEWQLGQEERDNGVLLLIAINERKMRIEVGEGLEGVLTDALSNRIIRNEIAPAFRLGDYDSGVQAGVGGIIKAIGGEYSVTDFDNGGKEKKEKESPDVGSPLIFGFSLFIYCLLGFYTLLGLFSGQRAWFMYFTLIPLWGLLPIIILDGSVIIFLAYLIGYPLLKMIINKTKWGQRLTKKLGSIDFSGLGSSSSLGTMSSSVRSSGGGDGSSGYGGGSSGGNFSGGGGGFSGGGSSGSW